ncbi:hypothetical protein H5410_019801 [Solanum commersonii]|uniref:Uncharacterized protein n=1 Tax=Solanum commersonii TaxID=4109 RepID=A0A9J5Z9C8_SOLCO|nr:hypothetical protein H5410_019801 [Solanum commersonii]
MEYNIKKAHNSNQRTILLVSSSAESKLLNILLSPGNKDINLSLSLSTWSFLLAKIALSVTYFAVAAFSCRFGNISFIMDSSGIPSGECLTVNCSGRRIKLSLIVGSSPLPTRNLAEAADDNYHPYETWLWPLTGDIYWQGIYERERGERYRRKMDKKRKARTKGYMKGREKSDTGKKWTRRERQERNYRTE